MKESIRLLIVDDHEQVRRELATKLFRHLNLQVVGWADRGDAALRLVAELQANVVLLDAQMAEGLAICRAIMKQQPETKVVVLTSYADERERQEAHRAGAAAYLLKDIPSEELLRRVETLRTQQPEASQPRRGRKEEVLAEETDNPIEQDRLELDKQEKP